MPPRGCLIGSAECWGRGPESWVLGAERDAGRVYLVFLVYLVYLVGRTGGGLSGLSRLRDEGRWKT